MYKVVLMRPVGYTQIFSFLENKTLRIPKTTAINSSPVVANRPVYSWCQISGRDMMGYKCREEFQRGKLIEKIVAKDKMVVAETKCG